jgi:hypothetical protein
MTLVFGVILFSVIPAKAGIHLDFNILDSRLRGNDRGDTDFALF